MIWIAGGGAVVVYGLSLLGFDLGAVVCSLPVIAACLRYAGEVAP